MFSKLNKIISIFFLILISNSAQASIINLIAQMDGDQAGVESSGKGFATMTFDDVTKKFNWDIEWSDLEGEVTNAHFHGPAFPGVNAGIQVPIDYTSNPTSGMAILDVEQASDLITGLWYINIHSSFKPAGEIRGQVNVAPLPAAIWFFGAGLFSLIGINRIKTNV